MSFLIILNSKLKMNQLSPDGRHNERLNKNYSNKDIDPSRTPLNYHLKEAIGSYEATFYAIREKEHLKGNLRLTEEKQSNVACEFVITSDDVFLIGSVKNAPENSLKKRTSSLARKSAVNSISSQQSFISMKKRRICT